MRNINAKRIVAKIGTNVITNKDGNLDEEVMAKLVQQIARIKNMGKDVVIITSGAIGAGMKELNLKSKPRDIVMKQVCAAIGQNILMSRYYSLFIKHSMKVAQILLSYDTFSNRKTYLNLRNSINKLLELKVIPIINENDPISIDEIGPSFGDNDLLSAFVASKIEADLLITLTNVDGLFDRNPNEKNANLIKEVLNIDKNIEKISGKASYLGVGGMQTKVKAAKLATQSGSYAVIANGRLDNVLIRIINNEDIGTIFYPKQKLPSKKRWIMQSKSKGAIYADAGAKEALLKGKNLLPAGITGIEGSFNAGDVVDIACNGRIFARCICDYSHAELNKAKGKKTAEISKILGANFHKNVVKRENLVFI